MIKRRFHYLMKIENSSSLLEKQSPIFRLKFSKLIEPVWLPHSWTLIATPNLNLRLIAAYLDTTLRDEGKGNPLPLKFGRFLNKEKK